MSLSNNKEIEQHLQALCGGHVTFAWIDYADIDYPAAAARGGHKVCCAIKIHDLDQVPEGGEAKYSYAYSWCSPKDQFSKQEGRIVALRKLYRVVTGHEPGQATVTRSDTMHREIQAAVRNKLKFRVNGTPRWSWDFEGA